MTETRKHSTSKTDDDFLFATRSIRRENFDTSLKGASDLYQPFITSLRDQTKFMGRDLSPATLAELKPDADKLNQDAGALYAKVQEALDATDPTRVSAAQESAEQEETVPEGAPEALDEEAEDGGG